MLPEHSQLRLFERCQGHGPDTSTFCVAMHFAIPGGPVSSTEFATAAVAAELDVPLVQEAQFRQKTLYQRTLRVWTLSWHWQFQEAEPHRHTFSTTERETLVVPFALVQEDSASSEDFASTDSDVALCFTNPGGRASPTDFAAVVAAAMVVHVVLDQEDPASPENIASSDSVEALYFFASPGG